jgi:hypothetical protein
MEQITDWSRMREICTHGSEGGAGQKPRSYLYPLAAEDTIVGEATGLCRNPPCRNSHVEKAKLISIAVNGKRSS